jgi:hypothetical protein
MLSVSAFSRLTIGFPFPSVLRREGHPCDRAAGTAPCLPSVSGAAIAGGQGLYPEHGPHLLHPRVVRVPAAEACLGSLPGAPLIIGDPASTADRAAGVPQPRRDITAVTA